MAIESVEPIGSESRPQQTVLNQEAGEGEGGEFAAVLDSSGSTAAQESGGLAGAQGAESPSAIPAPQSVETAQPVQGVEAADPVDGRSVVDTIARIGDGHERLEMLIAELRSGQSFTAQELLGLQAEIYKLTEGLTATTKVVGEAVSTVRTLFQQQA